MTYDLEISLARHPHIAAGGVILSRLSLLSSMTYTGPNLLLVQDT